MEKSNTKNGIHKELLIALIAAAIISIIIVFFMPQISAFGYGWLKGFFEPQIIG